MIFECQNLGPQAAHVASAQQVVANREHVREAAATSDESAQQAVVESEFLN